MAERRERILEAARGIIGEKGYEALTMRELARASRVTVPTIYNLVGSKEQVLFAAVEEQTERFVAGLHRAGGDVIGVVEASVRELLRMPRYYRALLLLLLTSDAADPARRSVGRALGDQLDAALAELTAAGELASWVDPAVLRDRIRAHFEMTSLQWAKGWLSASAFRAAARYEAAVLLLSVTSGRSHRALERVARESQPEVRARAAGNGAREARG